MRLYMSMYVYVGKRERKTCESKYFSEYMLKFVYLCVL